jgi:hypothetical protein
MMRMNMPRSPPIASLRLCFVQAFARMEWSNALFQTAQAASAFRCICFFGSGVLQPSVASASLINMFLHDLPGLRYAPNNS